MKSPCVYIMASGRNGTLYCSVISDLARRAYEHRTGACEGYTKKYNWTKLVWYEPSLRMEDATQREKQIKGGNRVSKLAAIAAMNPTWADLYETLKN